MRISKRQLRRIIKEERQKLLSEVHPAVEEGISRGVMDGVWDWLDAEFAPSMTGEDVWVNPAYTESIAHALEVVAKEVRTSGKSYGG